MKVCNCANCKVEMSSEIISGILDSRFPRRVSIGGRIKGRPYCGKCLISYHGVGGRSGIYKGEPSPGWENMIKGMEDG